MPDYYSYLWEALKRGDLDSVGWRETVFAKARQTLRQRLLTERPPLTRTEVKLNSDALEAAIAAVRSELRQRDSGRAAGAQADRANEDAIDAGPSVTVDAGRKALPFPLKRVGWIIAAVAIAAIAAGLYAFMATQQHQQVPPAGKASGSNDRAATFRPGKRLRHAALDGDLPPGVDGGSTDSDVPFVFHRQPVFYRTTQPVGTIIIEKQQHFLYLIQPNLVALRYGVGVGKPCADVAGLRRISSKVEWPKWEAPADMVAHKLAPPGLMPGGPGNPLGARLIELDDGSSRIHGTNAPKTIGSSVNSGCIRLVNDDVVDLYNRISVGDRVILQD